MPLIYEPKGKAREYSPLALNVYTQGCDHQCTYCYCRNIAPGWGAVPKPRNLKGLEKEAEKAKGQILLSFMGDPYCKANDEYNNTGEALAILYEAKCNVAILTKGGNRCLEDLDLFENWHLTGGRIKVGATLTFGSTKKSLGYEPGAAVPGNRLAALKVLKKRGIKTWASIEPVIDPVESIKIIERSLPYVDEYKIGKLNHQKSDIDWTKFCLAAVDMLRGANKKFYVKKDLQAFVGPGMLRACEITQPN